jgi:hypothetical protein
LQPDKAVPATAFLSTNLAATERRWDMGKQKRVPLNTPEDWKVFFDGLIGHRKRIIAELERKYRVERNPLAAWDAFIFCREWRVTTPEWVLQYLYGSAKRLMSAVPGKETDRAVEDHIVKALGMKTRGKGSAFSRYLDTLVRHRVVRMVLAKIKEDPNRMKADIFSEVAEELEDKKLYISNVTVENWYNDLKGKL